MDESPKRSTISKSKSGGIDSGYYHGEFIGYEGGVFQSEVVSMDGEPRDEEFLATVLVMIKKEETPSEEDMTLTDSKIKRVEFISQTCDEHKLKHLTCSPNCPNRTIESIVKLSDEENNSYLDGENGSSSPDEGHGVPYHSDAGSSSDDLFDNINYRRRTSKMRAKLTTPTNAIKSKKSKKQPNKLDLDISYTNGNGKVRGSKRKSELYEADSGEFVVPPKRKYSKQRKIVKGMEMFWNAPTESYGLAKPKSPDQYQEVIKWALSQLPKKSGTTEEVFCGVKEYGWPELKKGNTREALICKNTISRILYEHFVEKLINPKGESVFSLSEDEDETVDIEEDGIPDEESKSRSCSKHTSEEKCSSDCPFRRNGSNQTRKRDLEVVNRENRNREDRKPKREIRRRTSLTSEESPEEPWWPNGTEDESSPLEGSSDQTVRKRGPNTTTTTKKAPSSSLAQHNNNGRGRRWVRFACEKHRREHARCPDNCPMRKKSYVEDDLVDDDMDVESPELKGSPKSPEEVILDDCAL